MKLPPASIKPLGWLKGQLLLQADGLNGRMPEISDYLDINTTGWTHPERDGFEEVGYWFRGFSPLGYVLHDPRIMDTTRQWVEAVIATQTDDGWFGPTSLRTSMSGMPDFWPHMPLLYGIRTYQEATNDPRIVPFMTKYFKFQNTQDVRVFSGGWGAFRWADNIDSVYWLYNRTGDAFLLDLVNKIHQNCAHYSGTDLPTYHNVNLSQGFREGAQYWLAAGDPQFIKDTYSAYDRIFDTCGQFPGGGFAGDEGIRPGYYDPRQGFETCGVAELMLSFEILTRVTGDPKWADRCEYIALNTLPATLDPQGKGCHYLTSSNATALLEKGMQHKQFDDSPGAMSTYQPGIHNYRCCPHNYGMAWPMFTENLWLASSDNGICASLYAPSQVSAIVGDGTGIKIDCATDFPFKDTVNLTVTTPKPVSFPLYLRVPRWCDDVSVKINGIPVSSKANSQSYLVLSREWKNGDSVALHLPMRTTVTTWAKNRNAVSVDHGPLTYSLAIPETWHQYAGSAGWPEWEVTTSAPWNYGLVLNRNAPEQSFDLITKAGDIPANPFTPSSAPIEMRAKAKRIPGWAADDDGMTPVLQESPAKSEAATENISLIPMGAARLRITAFPTIAPAGTGKAWLPTAHYIATVSASQDVEFGQPYAVLYGDEPASSHDTSCPKQVWPNRGTTEWIQYKFPKPVKLTGAATYWFDDSGMAHGWYPNAGGQRGPKSWYLEYRDTDSWKEVVPLPEAGYGTALDQYNHVSFKPIVTSAIRLVVQPNQASTALLAWKVFDGNIQIVPTQSEAAVAALEMGTGSFLAGDRTAPVAWFAADRIADSSPNTGVTTWLDRSPGINDAVSIGDSAPTLLPNAINGLAVLHFDAGRQQFMCFDRPVQDDFTIACVFRSTQGISDSGNYFQGAGLVQGEVGGVTDDFGLALNAKGQITAGTGNPDTSVQSPAGYNDGKPHLAVFERTKSTGTFRLYVDGKLVATGTAGKQSLTAPTQLGIGAQNNGANKLTGDIAEIVLSSLAMTDTDRTALTQRLMTKWGI
jgi:hypothetical protein